MLTDITIKTDKFDCDFNDLSNNTIILCSKPSVKNRLFEKISRIWRSDVPEGEQDGVIYCYDQYDEVPERDDSSQFNTCYLYTTTVELMNRQKFVLTTESAFILQAHTPEDIWFADENEDGVITCIAFTDFIGYRTMWKHGVFSIYKSFINGKFNVM